MLVLEALDAYLLQLEADGRSPHTIGQARRHVRMLADWLATSGRADEIGQLAHEDVARFLASDTVRHTADGRPRKPSSANALRSSLRAFFGFAHAAGYCATNPGRLIRRAMCGPPRPKALTEDEQQRLLHALAGAATEAERRDRALFTLLLRCGPRIGSTLAARVEDLDLGAGELILRREKGRRERVLYLPEPVVELLRAHVGDRTAGPLFGRLGTRQAARRLAGWCERAGIRRVGPHALRHCFATRLYARTGDLLLVKAALGHASIASTTVYAEVGRERLREVVGSHP